MGRGRPSSLSLLPRAKCPFGDQPLPGQLPEKQRQDGEKASKVQRQACKAGQLCGLPYKPRELTQTPASPRGRQSWLRANKKHSLFPTRIGRIAELKPNSTADQTDTRSLALSNKGPRESQKRPSPSPHAGCCCLISTHSPWACPGMHLHPTAGGSSNTSSHLVPKAEMPLKSQDSRTEMNGESEPQCKHANTTLIKPKAGD